MVSAPSSMLSSPAIIRSSVVLPDPDGPRNTTSSPEATSRLTSRITSTVPNRFDTRCSEIPAMPILLSPRSRFG